MNKKNKTVILVLLAIFLLLAAAVGVLLALKPGDEPEPTEPEVITTGQEEQETRKPGVYYVTILPSANGTVTANVTEAKEGDEIRLTVTPDEGYELLSLTANGKACEMTFAMPAEDVSVLARFALPEIATEPEQEGSNVVHPNGIFFGSAGGQHSSDVLNMKTDSGENPYLLMDANKATPLYTYVKGSYSKQFYLETTVKVTGIRKNEGYPKFGLASHDGKDMVKFYLDMNTDKLVSAVGTVHQLMGKEDDWAGQSTWNLNKKLDLSKQSVKLGLLRNGKDYYFYINDQLVSFGSDLSERNAAAGVFSFGTSLKLSKYRLIKSGSALDALLTEAKADAEAFCGAALSENYFTGKSGVYTLSTDSDALYKVDDVTVQGKPMRAANYSLRGTLKLTKADDWGQARILITNDPGNEYFIALEQIAKDQYQIFTMSKAGEGEWTDWRLIESAALNGKRNEINFEVIVIGNQLSFLIEDEICYQTSRVPMTESTVKFTGYNKATTTVSGLKLQVFESKTAAESYAAGKTVKAYETQFQARMDALYKEYITDRNCSGGTVLLGSSTMDFWGAWEAQTGLTKYVNGYNVGIGGTTVLDWLHAYDKLVKPFAADRYVVYVGGNDVSVWGYSGEETALRLQTLFEKLHADFPNAELYYIYTFPTPGSYADGVFHNDKYTKLIACAKERLEKLGYVKTVDTTHLLMTADEKNVKKELFREDDIHLNDDGYALWSSYLYDVIFRGENFGAAGDHKTTNGIELWIDRGENAAIKLFGGAPRYAYLHDVLADQFSFEVELNAEAVLNDDGFPKFGLMTADSTKMVKLYVDTNPELTATHVGVVQQPAEGEDDWANAQWDAVSGMAFTGNDTVKLKLVRDGKAYYFYVNDELVLFDENGLTEEKSAVGIFSFNVVLNANNYKIATGSEAYSQINQAKADRQELAKTYLTTNFFAETEGVYTLTTDSDAQHKVDDVKIGRKVLRTAYYSVKGKLTLSDADPWGQARILLSADAQNEYFIALEHVGGGNYQIFTMSKANEDGWNEWRLIEHADVNGNRNAIDFEVIVNGDQVYFLVDNEICYQTSRVSMTESTVKFTGFNVATTTVEKLEAQVFADSASVAAYVATKQEKAFVTRFRNRMDALYEEYITQQGCAGKGGTLIFGDSNMDFWSTWEEQSGLTKYVNGYNLGIGGSAVIDWLSVYDRMILPFAADRFVILMGDNDINVWGRSGEEAVQNLKTLFEKLHADHPNAEIYYIYTTPSPSAYENGVYKNAKLGALIAGSKALCESLDYVQGIDLFDRMVTADKQNANEALFAADKLHMSEAGYKVFSDHLYETIFRGETFGASGSYKTNTHVELATDKGENATVKIFGNAPRYAYLHNVFTDKFCFETEVNVEAVLNNDGWPKFGLMVHGASEMVKFFVDMTPSLTATHVGVVYQPAGGNDDWGGSRSVSVPGMSFAGSDTVKLKLVRDGKAYYFYVNDTLVLFDEYGFLAEKGAVGLFSFNTVFTASSYCVTVDGAASNAISSAKAKMAELTQMDLTCNWFADQGGVYTLTTDSNAEHKVDDVTRGGSVMREKYYSVKGKLTLTGAGDWGQARILVSADANNEYFIALERTNAGKFQIFTMSKRNRNYWYDWIEILHADVNGNRNSIDFEVIVIGNKLYFLIDDKVVYTDSSVSMTESTVKFTGYNVGTTTLENLSAKVFTNQTVAERYLAEKN